MSGHTPNLHLLQNTVADILERRLEPLFVKGMQLTFIARLPGNDEADVLVSSERDYRELVKLVRRTIDRQAAAIAERQQAACAVEKGVKP